MEIKRTPLWLLPYQYIFKHLTESWKKHKMQIPKKKKKNPIQYVILILSRVTISAYDLIGCPEKKKKIKGAGVVAVVDLKNSKGTKRKISDRSFHTNSVPNRLKYMRKCWPVEAPIWRLLSEGGGTLGPRGPFCGGGPQRSGVFSNPWEPGCCNSPREDWKPRGGVSSKGARVGDGLWVGAGPKRGCGLSRLWVGAGPLDGWGLNEGPWETEGTREGKRLWGAVGLWEGGFRLCIESKGGGFVLGYEPGNTGNTVFKYYISITNRFHKLMYEFKKKNPVYIYFFMHHCISFCTLQSHVMA